MLEVAELVAPQRATGRTYWQAQGIAELALGQFETAREAGDRAGQRRAYYLLAGYYGRTRRIVRSAVTRRREALAQAALRNLIVMHRPLIAMHHAAPGTVPLALVLERSDRDAMVRDLVMRVLGDSAEALVTATIVTRVNETDLLGPIKAGTVQRHIADLEASGHVTRTPKGFTRSTRTYTELDADAASLGALFDADLQSRLEAAGFRGLHDVDARQDAFRDAFTGATSLGTGTADLVIEVASTLLEAAPQAAGGWHHADLLNSPYPRPYQYEAYAVFRSGGYKGQLVESPTGSGKTMIGMMCIQDWMRTLRPGQSILVLVPTANYQQQWIGELCYKPIGLRLPPELVFAGTPNQLERFQRRTGSHPAVLLMTYAALAQTGSGVGKGGFDIDSIEMFLQAANVQYVALDEVHKVVEDMRSVSADVTRQLVEWLRDGSLRGLIGFSGTAEAYRNRFSGLGLTLAHAIPLETLIGYGFVAPFAEFGVPFANSTRERTIRDLLDAYKASLLAYLDELGVDRLRQLFAEVPMVERVSIAREHLHMYRGRADGDAATAKRLAEWEQPGPIGVTDSALVIILQIAHGWSDLDLAAQAGMEPGRFDRFREEFEDLRRRLKDLIYLPSTIARLSLPGFAETFDRESLRSLGSTERSAAARSSRTDDLLAVTVTGLYRQLTDWYLRTGEGRVEAIKAMIDAERSVRPVSGTIVFDLGKRIRWRSGLTAPGYDGVAGLFTQLLGDERFTVMAALSSEMYFTCNEQDPLPPRIATFIEDTLMRGDLAEAMFGLSTQGLGIDPATLATLRSRFSDLVDAYVTTLRGVRTRRIGEFRRHVLTPFRRETRRLVKGTVGERLRSRLSTRNVHLEGLLVTFFDYVQIAEAFRQARIGEVEQVSGARQRFYVVPMPAGRRKQLMYDLTARIVDAPELPVNMVIVSSWARTGWNVIKPNVLIDATATRDVTAWQQLRGRAMRAMRTWTNDCYRLLLILRSDGELDSQAPPELLESLLMPLADAPEVAPGVRERLRATGLAGLTASDRDALAIALMRNRNKVTHIFEMVKAAGSTRQVEYDRPNRVWRRREAIARKHAYEASVDPFSGEIVTGVQHAPLLYASDPRTDLPEDLQARITKVIRGRDDLIVDGWLNATID